MKALKFLTMFMVFTFGVQVMFAQEGPTNAEKEDADWAAYFKRAENKKRAYTLCTRTDPCYITDDDEWFTASNSIKGEMGDPKLVNALLQYNQEQLYMKLSGRVKQMTSYYFDYMNISGDRNASNHIEGLCQKEINQLVNETREACRETLDDFNDKSKIIVFMSIKVRKTDLRNVMEEAIKSDAEAKVRYNEQKFRDAYSKAFEDKQPQE